jgi:hypothetical protein
MYADVMRDAVYIYGDVMETAAGADCAACAARAMHQCCVSTGMSFFALIGPLISPSVVFVLISPIYAYHHCEYRASLVYIVYTSHYR